MLTLNVDIESVGSGGMTALVHAARTNQEEIVRILLNEGVHINVLDRADLTSLSNAVRGRQEEARQRAARSRRNV